jgi:hypothetical protein
LLKHFENLSGRALMAAKSKVKARKKSSARKPSTRKYDPRVGEEVREEMHHMWEGRHPDHPIKDRKQAIAIGLAKARKKGEKVPPVPGKRAA